MSLDTPVFKFNNIYSFSAQFQKHIKSFENVYAKKFDKIKDLNILNTISSNINISLDIIQTKDVFDINFSNTNSTLSFNNYQLDYIVSTYKSILDKLTMPINNIIYLFNNNTNNIKTEFTKKNNNKLLCELLKEIRKDDSPKQIIDIYITEYMNVPKSSSDIVNFIYFFRRFPLIKFLFNHYLYKNYPSYFNIIRQYNLDNINYLLYKEFNVQSKAFKELKNTGLFSFDNDYTNDEYNSNYKNIVNPFFTFENTFENSFVNFSNGCKNRQLKKYNAIAAIENNNKIESIIYLFPFLYKISNIFLLKGVIRSVVTKIIEENIGIMYFDDKYYIQSPNQIFFAVLNNTSPLIDLNTVFELDPIENHELILKQFIILFAYDLILNQINITDVFTNLRIEDILIKMSTFILNIYGVYNRAELDKQEDFFNTINFYPQYQTQYETIETPITNSINTEVGFELISPESTIYKFWYNLLIPNESRFISYFYLFAGFLLFKDLKFKTLVENDLYKISNLFYIFNYFHNDAKELNPLFIFAAFSDGENKWIKNYDYKKNYFLDWLIEYFDYCFPNVNKFIIN